MRQSARGFDPAARWATRSAREVIGPPADCGMDIWASSVRKCGLAWSAEFDRNLVAARPTYKAGSALTPVAGYRLPDRERRQCGGVRAHDAWPQCHGQHKTALADAFAFLRIKAPFGSGEDAPSSLFPDMFQRVRDGGGVSALVAKEESPVRGPRP